MSQRVATWGLIALGNLLGAAATQAEGVSFATRRDFPGGGSPVSMAVGAFNRDGIPDLAVANGIIQILLGHGDGTFQTAQSVAAAGASTSVMGGDLNGHGVLDTTSPSDNTCRVS